MEPEWNSLTAEPAGEAADRLGAIVREGGVLLLLPGGTTDAGRFLGTRWRSMEEAGENGFVLAQWDRREGPLADTREGRSLPLDRVEVRRRQVPDGTGLVLARFSDEEPGLLRVSAGRGAAYFLATWPGAASSLGEGVVWLPFLQRLREAGGGRLLGETHVECGVWQPGTSSVGMAWERVAPEAGRGPAGNGWRTGIYRQAESTLAVSNGVGNWFPLRTSAPAEILHLTLRTVL